MSNWLFMHLKWIRTVMQSVIHSSILQMKLICQVSKLNRNLIIKLENSY